MSAKYVVISYDDDEQRYYDDTVTAEDSEQAIIFVQQLPPYTISSRAFSREDLEYLRAVMARPADFDASQPLPEEVQE